MKKNTVSLMLIGAMIVSMCAATNVMAEDGNEVEISFYTTETGKDQMFQDLIADFEEKNSGIK